ncbi:MAG: class I mannose-6-phosphate isomerase [Erysipelotrichaceae bacterium]|nr:class I mannose-6-phosphate isomerase [Erysipelotrichaceae bacterium]
MKPLVLTTIQDKTIWGNNILSQKRGSDENIGTWWEVSAHPYCTNSVANMDEHPTLQALIDQDPEGILGPGYTLHEMLRLAYLDAKEDLSIQVHPGDEYAWAHSDDNGKTESWYIIDCKPGATLIAGTTTDDPEVIRAGLEDHTIMNVLKKWEMHPGDFIVIPYGTLHSLGKDILALEVGTNSNTTYRFYDYDRTDARGNKRPLHLKESFDVLQAANQPVYVPAQNKTHRCADTEFFTVDEWFTEKEETFVCDGHYFIVSNISEQDILIHWEKEEIVLPAYDSALIPYSAKQITLESGCHVLISNPRKEKK